jgi:hypothetical protein
MDVAMNRSLLYGAIALIITLGVSLVIAIQINGFLGLSMQDKELPDVTLPAANTDLAPPAAAGSGQVLPLRIADFGSVGVIPDAGNWGNDYSHNLRHLEKAILPDPPYIDEAWNESLLAFFDKEDVHTRTYGHNLDFPAFNFTEAKIGAHLAKNTVASRNMAAILSIVAIAALLSGLILKPGSRWRTGMRMAAEALVLPFRQEALRSSQAPSLLAPVFMFLLTIVLAPLCLTFFAAPVTTTAIYGFSATYLVMLLLFLGRKNLPALVSTLAPVMLLCLIYLLVSSIRGPGFPWYFFWINEEFRMALVVSSVFLLLWSYVILYASGRKWFKQTPGTMVSMIIIMEGVQFTLLGMVSHVATLEKSLTAINDELAVLPGGLSRILGITTHLNIPTDIPVYLIGAGICLAGTGILFRGLMRKTMFKKGSI